MTWDFYYAQEEHHCRLPPVPDPLNIPMNKVKKAFLKMLIVSKRSPKHKLYLRSTNAFNFERRRQVLSKSWYVIHPFSLFAGIWETVMFFAYILDMCVSPVIGLNLLSIGSLTFIPTVLNVVRLFFTGYIHRQRREIVIDHKSIVYTYLRGWFFVDIIGVIPWWKFVIFCSLLVGRPLSEDVKMHMGFLRLLYIFVHHLFLRSMVLMLEFLNAPVRFVSLMKSIVLSFLFFQWMAALQWIVPRCVHGNHLRIENGSWMNIAGFPDMVKPIDMPPFTLYAACMFQAISQILLLGFGRHVPMTAEDDYLWVLGVLAGRVFFFLMIVQVVTLNNWVISPNVKYRIMMTHVNRFLLSRRLPPLLRHKVLAYCEYRFNKSYFNEKKLLSLMSASLREQLRLHNCRRLFAESRIFRDVPQPVQERLLRCLQPDVFLPNDVLIRAGAYGDCMFFLSSGTVAVLARSGVEMQHLHDGAFFGELAIVSARDRRIATVVAVEVSEVYRLERDDFQRLVRPLQEVYATVLRVAEERAVQMNLLETAHRRYLSYMYSRAHTAGSLSTSSKA